jgi:DNA polymerase-3 subunit delta'
MSAVNLPLKGHIRITSEIETEIQTLQDQLHPLRVVVFFEDTFKIEHAKAVTAEAYISEAQTKFIIIAAQEFTAVAQNAMLKLLEEPPRNIEFILLTPTKSNLLTTVRSRLPILKTLKTHEHREVDVTLGRIDYGEVFHFLKQHARVGKSEAKSLVEALFYKATVQEQLILSKEQLEDFDRAYRLLELNSRPQTVLAMLLMSFVKER